MNFNIHFFDNEFNSVLAFWLKKVPASNGFGFNSEIAVNGIINSNSLMGSMFLARIIYGASAACKSLNTNKYKSLADASFELLQQQFKNPKGGYYWARAKSGEIIHDSENINLAQAFILYGLSEYVSIAKNPEVDSLLYEHIQFIQNTLADKTHGGYFDDYDINWNPLKNQTKALGTHLHLLEAFTKLYQYNKNKLLIPIIEELITLLIEKFISENTTDFLHRLTPSWQPLANEIWAGHNVESSWILCKAAKSINNNYLLNLCEKLALKIINSTLKTAYDKKEGGLFNVIKSGLPIKQGKIWWPQAEMTIALLNCYSITNNKLYLEKALEFKNYISHNFIDASGEWYTEIYIDKKPDTNQPIIHFWKSMYHNVRYYVEVKERIQPNN